MFKADGSFLVHDDAGGFRPLNWATYPLTREPQPVAKAPLAVPPSGSPAPPASRLR